MNTYRDFTGNCDSSQSIYLNRASFFKDLMEFIIKFPQHTYECLKELYKFDKDKQLKELSIQLQIRSCLFNDMHLKLRYSFYSIRDQVRYPYKTEKVFEGKVLRFGYIHNLKAWLNKAKLSGNHSEGRRIEYEILMEENLKDNLKEIEFLCDLEQLVKTQRNFYVKQTLESFPKEIEINIR